MLRFVCGIVFISFFALCNVAVASTDNLEPKEVNWPFEGYLGYNDKAAAQRGFQVYKQVCAACHSLKRMSYRNLAKLGFSEKEIKAVAAEYSVTDGPNDDGEMFKRPALPSDAFVSPFDNDQAARAANNGALPPDLSLIVKAREDGANYIYSILTGYKDAPKDFHLSSGMNYNPYFPGHQIAMPAPLAENAVTYQDGTVATADQMARDVVTFLQFAAEPEMEQRKEAGIKVLIYLAIFTILFYLAKRAIWRDITR